jgi:hypothetical protein
MGSSTFQRKCPIPSVFAERISAAHGGRNPISPHFVDPKHLPLVRVSHGRLLCREIAERPMAIARERRQADPLSHDQPSSTAWNFAGFRNVSRGERPWRAFNTAEAGTTRSEPRQRCHSLGD